MKGAVESTNKLAGQGLAALFANTDLAAGGAPASLARPISLAALSGGLLVPGGTLQRARQRGAWVGICEPQLVAAVGSLSVGRGPGSVASIGDRVVVVATGQIGWQPIVSGIGCHVDWHPGAAVSRGATLSDASGNCGRKKNEARGFVVSSIRDGSPPSAQRESGSRLVQRGVSDGAVCICSAAGAGGKAKESCGYRMPIANTGPYS